jgi:hypothetical protein
MDVVAPSRGLAAVGKALSGSQIDFASATYYSREMRVPRYRFAFWLSLVAAVVGASSDSEQLTGAILVIWGVGCAGAILRDGVRVYARARRFQSEDS